MDCTVLPKNRECIISETTEKGYFLLLRANTHWMGELYADFEKRIYKVTSVRERDDVTLGYFREFLKDNGWKEVY